MALRKTEAAEALGVSLDFFEDHIQSELRVIRRGRLVLIPRSELLAWMDRNTAAVLP
jgi:excisionase family DNA binding protein